MKDLSLLVWLTQLGLSVAMPLGGFILLAVWLHNSCGWGSWVLWIGIALGILTAINGLRGALKTLSLLAKSKKDPDPPTVAFNNHD